MEKTLREYLKNNYYLNHDDYDTERFAAFVADYYSMKGMEWTSDDEDVIREYGYDPNDYLNFTDEQLARMDEVQDAVIEFCRKMIHWPEGSIQKRENEEIVDDLYTEQIWCQIAERVADFLDKNGFAVNFPMHVVVGDKAGTEYITDEWEG